MSRVRSWKVCQGKASRWGELPHQARMGLLSAALENSGDGLREGSQRQIWGGGHGQAGSRASLVQRGRVLSCMGMEGDFWWPQEWGVDSSTRMSSHSTPQVRNLWDQIEGEALGESREDFWGRWFKHLLGGLGQCRNGTGCPRLSVVTQ